jgi:4-oxalocrotonate tautomerase
MIGWIAMPYVNIKITKEGATPDQKAQLIKGVTQLLVDVLGKNPQTMVVVIDEVETDNWGIGGETVTVLRSSREAPAEETPKKRGLPERLVQFIEQRKREKAEAAKSEGSEGDMVRGRTPLRKGKKKTR